MLRWPERVYVLGLAITAAKASNDSTRAEQRAGPWAYSRWAMRRPSSPRLLSACILVPARRCQAGRAACSRLLAPGVLDRLRCRNGRRE
jgi:hypothetical protein